MYTNGYWAAAHCYSSEYSSTALRPKLVIEYTVPPQLKDCDDVTAYGYNYDADLNTDCKVDTTDLLLFVDQWLANACDGFGPTWCDGVDFNWTYEVQLDDFDWFSRDWDKCNDPCDVSCTNNW